jgi:putative membrane protein
MVIRLRSAEVCLPPKSKRVKQSLASEEIASSGRAAKHSHNDMQTDSTREQKLCYYCRNHPVEENHMATLTNIVIAIVVVLHVGFLVLEMFLWNHPFGRKTFKMTKEVSESSATLAANQGLYNGFLAAGLLWGLLSGEFSVKVFFLVCVLIAGVFGGFTAKRSILYVQALPALLGLILLYGSA